MDSRVTSAVTIFALLAMATLFGLPQPATACTCTAGAPVELLERFGRPA